MNANIESQIKELVKELEKPFYGIGYLMDDYYMCQENLEFPSCSSAHFNAESELNSIITDIEDYGLEISKVLEKIAKLTGNREVIDDPFTYLKPFVEIPEEIDEILADLIWC